MLLFDHWFDNEGHIILGCFGGEKGGGMGGVFEASLRGNVGPEEVDHTLGETAEGDDGDFGRGEEAVLNGGLIDFAKGALGDDDEDLMGGDGLEFLMKPFDCLGGFAGLGGPLKEDV